MLRDHANRPARLRWADFTRALAVFLVVLAHVQYSGEGSSLIWTSYYALTRIAVPLFFMISGFLLLSKDESYVDFFKKRAIKVFLPFLVWSVIYLIWKREAFDQPLLEIVKIYFIKIIRGPRENHLWFFYELFGLYLFTPILRLFVQKASARDYLYFCGLWFIFMPVINLLREFTPVKFGFSYQFLGGYIGYFMFGYFAGGIEFGRRGRIAALILFISSLVLTITTMRLTQVLGLKTQYFEDYMSINVALMSVSAFILLNRLSISNASYPAVYLISSASFGIYLVHVIVMTELFANGIFSVLPVSGNSLYMIPLMGLIGFIFSLTLVLLLKKIPALKYIVP